MACDHARLDWNVVNVVGKEYSLTLGRSARFYDPPQVRLTIHLLRQQVRLIRQNKSLRNKVEVSRAVQRLHARDVFIKRVFACNLIRAREVVHLLVLSHCLVNLRLERGASPHHTPVLILAVGYLAKPVVLKSVLDYADIYAIVHLIEVPAVRWLVWPHVHWVNERTENKEAFAYFLLKATNL